MNYTYNVGWTPLTKGVYRGLEKFVKNGTEEQAYFSTKF